MHATHMKLKEEPIIMALVVMLVVVMFLVAYLLMQPEPRFKVVLTEQGCEAMMRLGQTITKLPHGCEVESVATIGWNWVSVGEIRLSKTAVTAMLRLNP